MKRLLLLFIALFFAMAAGAADMTGDIRGYDGVSVPSGTFIPVINLQEISTQYCPVGYKVKFISTNDLFLYETKVIPGDTAFYGYVEKVNMPIVGTNGAMKVKIDRMVLADGFEIPISAYVYTRNNNIIGGDPSAPVKLIAMPHYQTAFALPAKRVTLRMTPSMERKMGVHTVVRAGAEGLIVLTEPAEITHMIQKY